MKFLMMIPLFAAAIFSSSCRTACPLNPETMQPDCSRCRIAAHPSNCRCAMTHETTEESVIYTK